MGIELKNYMFRQFNKTKFTESSKTVLVDDHGYKNLQVLMIDGSGLMVHTVPKEEARYMTDPIQNGRERSMKTVIRQYRAFGKRTGMTKAAKSFLTKATKAA